MTTEQLELLDRITVIPGLMNGKPTIRGMRFPVVDIIQLLASGMTRDEIIEDFPFLEPDDISAALIFAAIRVEDTIPNAA